MKRYIFFIGTLGSGGAERVVSILSKKMAEQGLPVEILTYYDYPIFYEIHPDVKITSVESLSGEKNKISNFLWLRRYIKQNAKIVISFLAPFNIMAIAAKIGTGIPIIVADRNDPAKVPTNAAIRKLRDFLYMFANGIVLQTEKNKAYFNSIIQKKSKVIYNPVNMGKYAGISLEERKEKKIVTAGRLMPQKNQKLMINVFAEIVKRYPEHKLYIYGEGPSREELELLIKKLELEDSVVLAGSVTDLHEQIKDAQIFVLSSEYEGMPNALIEAMCMGIPVISTKVSGATDLIKNNENGLLVECDDKNALANAMIYILSDEKKSMQMARAAISLNEELATETILEQWIKFINSLMIEAKK